MTQIKSSQIIPSRTVEINPSVSPPRDLQINTDQNRYVSSNTIGAPTLEPPAAATIPGSTLPQSGAVTNDDISNQIIIPEVPIILSVNQEVVISDNGTSAIDLTIKLKDIPGINEFDIRVARNAGNL